MTKFQILALGARTKTTNMFALEPPLKINNSANSLMGNKDFSGLLLQPTLGVNAKYYISKTGYLSLGCNLAKSYSLNPTPDKVSFNTYQILFGGYFELNKDKHL